MTKSVDDSFIANLYFQSNGVQCNGWWPVKGAAFAS